MRALIVLLLPPLLLAAGPAEPSIRFESMPGVDFRFTTGSRGRHDLPEIMGGGVAMIDFNGDGWLDLYFANGGPIVAEPGKSGPGGALFRHEGHFKFTRVDSPPGPPYAMGCAVGDFDGDGRDDLFVSGWRGQRLYRNDRGRFVDVTDRAGLASDRWTTSAAFADLDGDGDLDLYVAAYLDYDPATAPYVASPDGRRDYAGPEFFEAQPDYLYRNNGDGTFTDVSVASGIALKDGRGLGVLIADLVGDPALDIFVANDGSANFLFENKGGLRFAETALAAGVALDGKGDALAGMGVSLGDLNDKPTLVVTNFLDRSTIAFARTSPGQYADVTSALGLAASTRTVNGFGIALADFDNDGHLDLIQANGHVLDRTRIGVPLAMRPTLLRNEGRRFVDAASTAGPTFTRPIVGRGLAVGDLDNDGRIDAVIAALDVPAIVLRNTSPSPPCLILELVGRPPSPASAVGAIARATSGERTIVRRVVGGGSYLSAADRRVFLGFSDAEKVERIQIRWPSGRMESWAGVSWRGVRRIIEGSGQSIPINEAPAW